VRSAGLASRYNRAVPILESLFCLTEGSSSIFDINFKILVQNLEEYQFAEAKSGHSPVEKFKTEIQVEYKQSGNLEIFKKHRISMGTLNEPDRPADQIQTLFPNENVLFQIINSLKLMKRACIFQYYSIKNHGKLFKYHAEPSVGNPRKFSFPNNFISDAGLRHSYYLNVIQKVIGIKLNSVLEIGAGFGGLCNLLAKERSVHSYYIVDLPENLLIQLYYLHTIFAKMATRFYLGINENLEILQFHVSTC
jgi:putative sugar O-methyltransferase